MTLDAKKQKKHIAALIAFGFIAPFFILMIGLVAFPNDFTSNPPKYSKYLIYANELSIAVFIFGCTLMGIKLADDKKVLASAGFTMMAIAQGVMFSTIFEAFGDLSSMELRDKTTNITIGGTMLYVPALLLISNYNEFPRWLNWAAIIINVPFVFFCVFYIAGYRDFKVMENVGNVGYTLFNLIQIFWGIWVWKRRYE